MMVSRSPISGPYMTSMGEIPAPFGCSVTELLGRVRYQRRAIVDGPPGHRNGYGKPRELTTPLGTITLRRPRVRGLEQRFESRILPLFVRRTREVSELLPELYLHGLADGDFDLGDRPRISPWQSSPTTPCATRPMSIPLVVASAA